MRSTLIAAALLAASFSSTSALADALLDKALANGGRYDRSDWAYTSTTRFWGTGDNVVSEAFHDRRSAALGRPDKERVVRFDPSLPKSKQLIVLSQTGSDSVHVETDEADELPRYSEMRDLIQGSPMRITDTPAQATYAFAVDPSKVKKIGSADLDVDIEGVQLQGRAVVQKTGPHAPYVKSVTVFLPGARGNAAGKMRQFSLGFRFAPDPKSGVQLMRAFGFDMNVQALGLVSADFALLNKIGDYRYVGD